LVFEKQKVRLSEVEWDEQKDEREGDAEREWIKVKADRGHGKDATEAQVVVCCSVLQCVAVCCSVLQCVAVCCSVLQCVAVCCQSGKYETAPVLQ